jgi:polyhydroxybutyrate depolymerase
MMGAVSVVMRAVLLASLAICGSAVAQQPAKPVDSCPEAGGCQVAGGYYRLVLPRQGVPGRPLGAIMFFHGYQGSAEEVVSDAGLGAVASHLGVALIAPAGAGRSWSFPGSPARHRDEFAFVAAVLDDAIGRFPIDPARIMASGFSQGGSMVWYLACRMPQRFAAFAPIAGAFWTPLPRDCAGPPPNLIHVHGTADAIVPIAGRSLRGGYRQGDLFESFAILAPGGCTASWAAAASQPGPPEAPSCRLALGCGGAARLELCLHAGGHVADPAWVERAWRLAIPNRAAASAALTSP